ncbi:hypothetical protein [Ancylobacter rudongensis]|uniref:Uncharacterized protein n=1 Tax=Ancylobacter rudongensis TaxID=177413 RepID=A0A1G4UPU5_9HYPH|nr:hypothetical protein [Ancylobacter rudongensis]SCW95658.1 hypothetical protein SAMN05660859_0080 [Ancylobacter rudongensis]
MTKIINLDAFVKPSPVTLDIDGVKHPMATATLDTFFANAKDLEDLKLDGGPVKELQVMIRMINRAFPSLTEAQIRSWSLEQLNGIAEIARTASGEVVEEAPAADQVGKAPSAS